MKVLKIIRSIFVWLMVALAVFMMIFTIVSVSTFDRADRSLFGYKAFIVLSDSMSKTDFNAGFGCRRSCTCCARYSASSMQSP